MTHEQIEAAAIAAPVAGSKQIHRRHPMANTTWRVRQGDGYYGWFIVRIGGPIAWIGGDGKLHEGYLDNTELEHHDKNGWGFWYFPTEAEAAFRLLLYTDPATALADFLTATGGSYEGTCQMCKGERSVSIEALTLNKQPDGSYTGVAFGDAQGLWPCPTCHGSGGPPSPALLGIAGDYYERAGDEMRASVLHQLSKQGE